MIKIILGVEVVEKGINMHSLVFFNINNYMEKEGFYNLV